MKHLFSTPVLLTVLQKYSPGRKYNLDLVKKNLENLWKVSKTASQCRFYTPLLNLSCLDGTSKNRLMNLRLIISRLIIIIFFALVSYGLTGSIAVRSTMGIILAIISLGATVIFLYLLPKLYQQSNKEEGTNE